MTNLAKFTGFTVESDLFRSNGASGFDVTHSAFGADPTGVADSTAACQAAITAAGASGYGGRVKWPAGNYLITGPLYQSNPFVYHDTAGAIKTIITFKPSAPAAVFNCFKADSPGVTNVLYGARFDGFSFYGHAAASAIQKIAIRLLDTSGVVIKNIVTSNWTGNSGSALTPSMGLQMQGRELTYVGQCLFSADRPISIEHNTNVTPRTNDCDHAHFQDIECLVQSANEDGYRIQDGTFITNLTIDGYQACVQGKHGVNFTDTSGGTGNRCFNIRIGNVRHEQASASGGWCVNWTANTAGLLFENLFSADIAGGYRLRYAMQALLLRCSDINSGSVALDVDNTCWDVEARGSNFGDNTTISIGTMLIAEESPKMGALRPIGASFYLANPAGPTTAIAHRRPVLTNAVFAGLQRWAAGDTLPFLVGTTTGWGVLNSTEAAYNIRFTDAGFCTMRAGTTTGVTPVTYSASMTFSAPAGNVAEIVATNGTAFTINAPTSPVTGQQITVSIKNTSGGALGAVTWNAVFKLATWTSPATGFTRAITFRYDGASWIEIGRNTTDVPN